jgi:hypothetical protein
MVCVLCGGEGEGGEGGGGEGANEVNLAWGGQLDAYGRFLKIVAHSCHANKLNMYSQVL